MYDLRSCPRREVRRREHPQIAFDPVVREEVWKSLNNLTLQGCESQIDQVANFKRAAPMKNPLNAIGP